MTDDTQRAHAGLRRPSKGDVAAALELRLHYPSLSEQMLAERSQWAAEQGVAAIWCRPEQVPIAARAVQGSQTGVAAVLDFHSRRDPLPQPGVVQATTLKLAESGATNLALIATRDRLQSDDGQLFRRCIEAATGAAHSLGATSRALIDVTGLTLDEQLAAAVMCRDAGASVIQVGIWDGRRAHFGPTRQVREAIGPGPKLKWTPMVPRLDTLLLGVAEGIDLFNGDVEALLMEASSPAEAPLA